MLEGRTLWVWRWHCPVAHEGAAGGKKSDFGCDPADKNVDRKVDDETLCCETEGKTSIHDEHTSFYCIYYVEHGLE